MTTLPEALDALRQHGATFAGEALLLRSGDTSTSGLTVTFQLDDGPDGYPANPFKGLQHGKNGQRFQVIAIPVSDDETPGNGGVAQLDEQPNLSGGKVCDAQKGPRSATRVPQSLHSGALSEEQGLLSEQASRVSAPPLGVVSGHQANTSLHAMRREPSSMLGLPSPDEEGRQSFRTRADGIKPSIAEEDPSGNCSMHSPVRELPQKASCGGTGVGSTPSAPAKRAWKDLSRSQQAGIKCGEPEFQRWLGARGRPETIVDDTARHLRERLGIDSRKQLDTDPAAAAKWDALMTDFDIVSGRMARP